VRDGRRARVEVVGLQAWERLFWGSSVNILGLKGKHGARRLLKQFSLTPPPPALSHTLSRSVQGGVVTVSGRARLGQELKST